MRWRSPLRPAYRLIATHGLSSFCLGLAYPYTAIYLADEPGVGTAGVALFYAAAGGANLLMALLLTARVLRLSQVTLGVLGTLLWFVGYLGMPVVSSFPAAAAAAMAIGSGQGCFMAALVPMINSLVTAEERRVVFARRYAVLNATLLAGSLVAGGLILTLPRTVIPFFFLANAVGILPLTLVILGLRRTVRDGAEEPESTGSDAMMPMLALWKVALPAALFQLAMYLFGFSQFEATAPLVSVRLMDMDLYVVSVLLAVSVAVIVSTQGLVTRLLSARSELDGLRVAVILWAVGYVVVGALAYTSHGLRLAGLLLYAVFMALGECAYSCSFHPWLISLVPDRELTRANALANSMMGVGNFAGPSFGVVLAMTGNASIVWLGLAACCTLTTVVVSVAARRSSPAVPQELSQP